jgi:hypothetical protein
LAQGAGPWHEGCDWPPDADDLATYLTARFDLQITDPDLATVAQYVATTNGPPDLYQRLRRVLSAGYTPGRVHRFLASFPSRVSAAELEPRYQMIVSTHYDAALERAFRDVDEPYDLVVYMASGADRGRFVHFPWEGGYESIKKPNEYTGLPVGEDGDLSRTIIVKIHGAVDGELADYRWKDNYVVTEDHYIDYLSRSPVESLVPGDILAKLTESHCLFLGYTMHDWNLRVFLQRIWGAGRLESQSWAVALEPNELEKAFWSRYGVELFASPLVNYVDQLDSWLEPQVAAET